MKTMTKMQTRKEVIANAKLRFQKTSVSQMKLYARGMNYLQRMTFMLNNPITIISEKVW